MKRRYLHIVICVYACLVLYPGDSMSSKPVDVIVCDGHKDDTVDGHGVGKVRDSRVHHLNLYKEFSWCVFDDNYIRCEHGNTKEVSERVEGATYTKITINRVSGKIEEQRMSIWRGMFMNLRFEGVCVEGKKKF